MTTHDSLPPVVVIGGCGFVGSHVSRQLLAEGRDVTIVDRCDETAVPAFVREVAGGRLRFVHGELGSARTLAESVGSRSDVQLINCAAVLPGPRTPLDFMEVNGAAVWRVCDFLRERQSSARFVHISTRSIYGRYEPAEGPLDEDTLPRPTDYYGASKAAGDLGISIFREQAGVDAVALRITGIYGALPGTGLDRDHSGNPVMAMVAAAKRGEPYIAKADADYRYEVTYVKDVVRGVLTLLSAARTSRAVYNLGGADGQPRLTEIADTVGRVFPHLACEYLAPGTGLPARAAMQGARLRQEFGYRPEWPVSRALVDYVYTLDTGEYGEAATAALPV